MPLYALKPANDLQILELLLENGSKPHRWEDWHGLSSDGSSLIVTLAVKEKRLDLLEKLLANSRDTFPKKHNRGVTHELVGRTDLGDLVSKTVAQVGSSEYLMSHTSFLSLWKSFN